MKERYLVKFVTDFNDSKVDLYEAGKVYEFENYSRAMFIVNMGHELVDSNKYKGEISKPVKFTEAKVEVRNFHDYNEVLEVTPVGTVLPVAEDIEKVLDEAGKALSELTTDKAEALAEQAEPEPVAEVVEPEAREEQPVEALVEQVKVKKTAKRRNSK